MTPLKFWVFKETTPSFVQLQRYISNRPPLNFCDSSPCSLFHSIPSTSQPGKCHQDNCPTLCKACIGQAFQDVRAQCRFKKVTTIVYNMFSLWIPDREFLDLNFNSVSFVRYNTFKELQLRVRFLERLLLGQYGKWQCRQQTQQSTLLWPSNRLLAQMDTLCMLLHSAYQE